MKYRSVFDIIGPVMIGPSSSHTAGAARIGRVARTLFGRQPEWARIHLYGSFAETYKGHGTDVAIIGGLLDYDTFDERIKTAFSEAEKLGLTYEFIPEEEEAVHPNTARHCHWGYPRRYGTDRHFDWWRYNGSCRTERISIATIRSLSSTSCRP